MTKFLCTALTLAFIAAALALATWAAANASPVLGVLLAAMVGAIAQQTKDIRAVKSVLDDTAP